MKNEERFKSFYESNLLCIGGPNQIEENHYHASETNEVHNYLIFLNLDLYLGDPGHPQHSC